MAYRCRLCKKHCGASPERLTHESVCAAGKGAQIMGDGRERHFVTSDGQHIPAPYFTTNPRAAATTTHQISSFMRQRAEDKATKLADMMGKDPMRVKDIHPLYCTLVGKPKLNSTCVSGFLRHHPRIFKCISRGIYKSKAQPEIAPVTTSYVGGDYSDTVKPIEEEQQLTSAEQYVVDSDISHRAALSIQKTAALLQFSVLMEEIGPPQALAMVAGMSKLGKAIVRR